ncbi:MAG: DUF4352 domain-containing protein [Pseudolysinimonas sp.]
MADATSPATPPPGSGPNMFGVIALVLAGLGFISAVIPVASGFTWLFVVPAIVLAIIGLTRKGRPKRLALAGLIVAIVGWLVAIIVTVVTVVVGVGAGIDSLDEIPVPDSTATGDTVALGQPVTNSDGFTFTLDGVECGLTSTGPDFFDEAPVGEWCRVDYTVANDGTESVSLLAGDIQLISGDLAYDADDATGQFGADYFTTDVNPGLSVPCVVFVDVPAGTTADSVVFEPALYFAAPVVSATS